MWGVGDDFVRNLGALVAGSRFLPVPRRAGDMQPVWVGDVTAAVAAVLADGTTAGMSLDVAGPERAPLARWVRLVAEARGLPATVLPAPRAMFRLGGWLMEKGRGDPLLTSGQARLLTAGMATTDSALPRLDIVPRALDVPAAREVLRVDAKRPPLRLRWGKPVA